MQRRPLSGMRHKHLDWVAIFWMKWKRPSQLWSVMLCFTLRGFPVCAASVCGGLKPMACIT